MDRFGWSTRFKIAGLGLSVILGATGCGGSRLSHAEIVSAATATVPASAPGNYQPADPSAAGATAASTVAGAATAAIASAASGIPPVAGTATGSSAAANTPGSAASKSTGPGVAAAAVPASRKNPTNRAGSASPTGPATGSPVSVGNLGTYSGVVGSFIGGIPKALQAWASWTDAHGGLGGHPVKINVGDDGGDPSRDQALVKQMIEQDKVVAILTNYTVFGNAAEIIDQTAAAAHVPVIGPDTVNATNYQSANVFPVAPYYADAATAVVKDMVNHGVNKLGFLYCVEIPRLCGVLADQIKDHTKGSKDGSTVVYFAAASITSPSYTSQCLSMKNAGATGGVLLMDGASDIRILRDCELIGLKFTKVQIAGFVLSTSDVKNPQLEGALVSTPTAPSDTTRLPAITDYRAAMQQYAPGVELDPNTAQAWTSGQVLAAASARMGPAYRWQDLYAGLYALTDPTHGGLTVPITYRQGQPPTVASCVFYQVIKDGKLTSPFGDRNFCL